jgi:ubiquinone/menaquinone biosynthesis C-methylase UbiE
LNSEVEAFYGSSRELATRIKENLAAAGKNLDQLTSADLASFDEFHIRGRRATLQLAERMALGQDCHVLDIGSGIGGPARTLAEAYGCRVTGIDLTRTFCETAKAISGWLGHTNMVRFVQCDATNLPFASASFDAAMTIHAAMNIPDKKAVYAGARRVLKPGRIFAIYDV